VPATVVMIPVMVFTLRTRLLFSSTMYKLPSASNVSPDGEDRSASFAAISSKLFPRLPVPAIVVIMPVIASTFRTRFPSRSAKCMFPDESKTTPHGLSNVADFAGIPSPLNSDLPVPANVEISREEPSTDLRARL
jgi:hypothetical protein